MISLAPFICRALPSVLSFDESARPVDLPQIKTPSRVLDGVSLFHCSLRSSTSLAYSELIRIP